MFSLNVLLFDVSHQGGMPDDEKFFGIAWSLDFPMRFMAQSWRSVSTSLPASSTCVSIFWPSRLYTWASQAALPGGARFTCNRFICVGLISMFTSSWVVPSMVTKYISPGRRETSRTPRFPHNRSGSRRNLRESACCDKFRCS